MHSYKYSLAGTIILFLLVNTTYYWEGLLGIWIILAELVLLLGFLILLAYLIRHLQTAIKERFKNKKRLYLTIIMICTLGLIAARPRGIIDFEKFEGKDVFVAWSEGVANCTTTLKLKANNQFYITDVCFGIYKSHGDYAVKNDTIRFNFSVASGGATYQFGVYKRFNNQLLLYQSKKDTLPYPMTVYKNELIK